MKTPETYAATVVAGLKDLTTRLTEDVPTEILQEAVSRSEIEVLAQVSPKKAVYLALFRDALRLVDLAMRADGQASNPEWRMVYPLVRALARAYAIQFPSDLGAYAELSPETAAGFLQTLRSLDRFPGFRSAGPALVGHWVVGQVAKAQRDPTVADEYERLALRIVDKVMALDGLSEAEARVRHQLRRFMVQNGPDLASSGAGEEPTSEPASAQQPLADETGPDSRLAAYCDPTGPEVFRSIAYSNEVWQRDPFDVVEIHAEAREVFASTVARLQGRPDHGRAFVVLGESGSGKTHLMRAFRNHLHEHQLGIGCYMQMSSGSDDYARYVLRNVLEGMERPYDPPFNSDSALLLLSNALTTHRGLVRPDFIDKLRDEDLDPKTLRSLVFQMADRLADHSTLSSVELDLIRILLLLQRRQPSLAQRALKWLRCESISEWDQQALMGIPPRSSREDPIRMLCQLSELVAATNLGVCCIMLDQLEEMFSLQDSTGNFQRAMAVVRQLLDDAPHTLVVVACLDDFWESHRPVLNQSTLDRLEATPAPIRLAGSRSRSDVESMIAVRLEHLYDRFGLRPPPNDPQFPFRPEEIQQLENLRARDVLSWCQTHQAAWQKAGHGVRVDMPPKAGPHRVREQTWAQRWNDFRVDHDGPLPSEDDRQRVDAVAWGFRRLGWTVTEHAHGVTLEDGRNALFVALTNRTTRGGHLDRQIRECRQEAGEHTLVLLRYGDFPSNPRTQVAQTLGQVVQAGGRKVTATDADWRTLQAFRDFEAEFSNEVGFEAWAREEDPLGRLALFLAIVDADSARAGRPRGSPPTAQAPIAPELPPRRAASEAKVEPAPSTSGVRLGWTRAIQPEAVSLEMDGWLRHAAFLGASGSGKTTLALNVIEQLADRGISTVMVDRKGDLAAYAEAERWAQPDPARAAAAQKLKDKLQVQVYTPGEQRGRPLGFPLVPGGLRDLDDHERTFVTKRAAAALGSMLELSRAQAGPMLTILAQALRVLGEVTEEPASLGLEDLVAFIDRQDPSLVNATGRIDMRHAKRLVESLEVLRIQSGHILDPGPEAFDPASLWGAPGSARLSIISTKFLPDHHAVDSWVARMLLELSRWASSHPSSSLQAALFLDEADVYLPAQSKTASKEVLMDFLKRARSAGISTMLATQSPGDFDYRARDQITHWFVGRVAEKRALDKMRALWADARIDVAGKLPTASTGEFFWLSEGHVTEFKADRSFMNAEQLSDSRIRELASGSQDG